MRTNKWLAGIVVLLIIIVAGSTYFYVKHKNPYVGERQAIFLTNGQVYFGNLVSQDNNYMTITGVYYLQQNQQALQNGTTADKQVQLIKLGQELHGPEDIMYIAKTQVLFYENMKNDSKVSQAIQDYLNKK